MKKLMIAAAALLDLQPHGFAGLVRLQHIQQIGRGFQRYAVRRQYHVAHGDVVVVQVAVIFHR